MPVGILVRFSDHCFTVEAQIDDVRPKYPSASRRDGRFCQQRYAASKNILGLVCSAADGRVWIGQQDRFLIIQLKNEGGQKITEYVIAFTLERHKGVAGVKLLMRIRTAFKSDEGRKADTFGDVSFQTLITCAIQRKSIKKNYSAKRKRPWK